MDEEPQPKHRGAWADAAALRDRAPREPKHRGSLADRSLGRLMQDFEQAQVYAERAETDAPYDLLRRMRRDRRDRLAAEIDRRILP